MKNVNLNLGLKMSRRTMLRAAGVMLSLPVLEAMTPAFAAITPAANAKRFVGITLMLGLHGPNLVPVGTGRSYRASRYLESVQDLRNDFTVVSGASHPGVSGGHSAEACILTACPNARGAVSRNTISLDQLMAKKLGQETRLPSMVLNTTTQKSPCYTENGAMIPAENDALHLFGRLFVTDSPAEQQRQMDLIRQGRSVMDVVMADTKKLQGTLGPTDKRKLDEYLSSIREIERQLDFSRLPFRRHRRVQCPGKAHRFALAKLDTVARQQSLRRLMGSCWYSS